VKLDTAVIRAHLETLSKELDSSDPHVSGIVSCAWRVIETALASAGVDLNELHPIRVRIDYFARSAPSIAPYGTQDFFARWLSDRDRQRAGVTGRSDRKPCASGS